MSGIGLLNEKPLHASLKAWYAMPGDQFEVAVGGFVIDIVRGDLLIEIQTRNLAMMKAKLVSLLRSHRVHVIHPIALEKWIVKPAADGGGELTRRKSPRAGRVEDLFKEMVSFPQLLSHPNFSLEVLMIREEEVRRFDGKRRWRTKGWGTEERRLLEVVERRLFEKPDDWLALLPVGIGAFTAKDLAAALGIQVRLAQRMAYCLRKVMAIDLIGMRGRAHTYALAAAPPEAATDRRRRPKTRRSDLRSSM
jgi:hypothetical protein